MLKTFVKYRKNATSYLTKHIEFNAMVHMIGGVGLGILIASPFANPHPVRWALVFVLASLLGHLYAMLAKK